MKKICFFISNLNNSGGTERVATLLANGFAKKNYSVSFLNLSGGDEPFFKLESNISIDQLYATKVSMKIYALETIFRIRQFVRKKEIDIFIDVDSVLTVFSVPALFRLKIKHICWEHFNLKFNLGSPFRSFGRFLATKYCDKIVTLTQRDKDYWCEKFYFSNPNRVVSIPNPCPYTVDQNTPSLDSKTILCIGRLTYQKGFDLLIQAWAMIFDQLPDWKIVIVGSGEDEQKLKQLAVDFDILKNIIFAGQQKNVELFYSKASLFCLSSRFEGFGMVLVEAQSYGLPIVSFNCEVGPAEIIIHNKNGLLIEPENIDELANGLLKLANISRKEYNEYSREAKISVQKFNINNIINVWENHL